VSGSTDVGGLVGQLGFSDLSQGQEAIARDSYFDNQTTGQSAAVGNISAGDGTAETRGEVTGLPTSGMQGESAKTTMSTLDFQTTWETVTSPDYYPTLQAVEGPATLVVSNLTAPAEAPPSGEINVTATVTNVGSVAGTQTVAFQFNGTTMTSTTVALNATENTTVAFSPTLPEQTGTSEHGVFTDDDSQTTTIDVVEDTFDVNYLTVPAEATPGAEINVSATVTNIGDAAGQQDVEFRFDGQTVANTTVTLNASASTTVEFTPTLPEQTGTFIHGVFTADDSQTAHIVLIEPCPLSLPGSENPPQDLDEDGLCEDTDGDGEFDIFDVQALFNDLDSDAVQNNPEAFNFNGDNNPDGVSIFDVQGLFNDL